MDKWTSCWCCQNAVPSATRGCSWSRSLTPVKGWKAKLTSHLYDGKEKTSYAVRWCPEFIRDEPREVHDYWLFEGSEK